MKWSKRQEVHHSNFAEILCTLSQYMQAKSVMWEQYMLPQRIPRGNESVCHARPLRYASAEFQYKESFDSRLGIEFRYLRGRKSRVFSR